MTPSAIQSLLEQAVKQHQAGNLNAAMPLYGQVLAAQPENADALHLLGLAKHQSGSSDEGIALIQRAIRVNPLSADFHANLAGVFVARQRIAEAADAIRRAAQIQSSNAEFHLRLAKYLQQLDRKREAIDAYRAGVRLKPDALMATLNLAVLLLEHGRASEALPLLESAVHRKPDSAEALANLGLALARLKHYEDAVTRYEQAVAIDPELAAAHTNLGAALLAVGRVTEAAAAHRRALELKPNWSAAQTNLAIVLSQLGEVDEALRLHDETLRESPDDANALFNRGLIRLTRGDFVNGWRDYEARLRVEELGRQQTFPQPQWRGEDARGKTILVHAEQGLGDTIQFVRYVPLLLQRGATVILQCDPALVRLMRQSFPNVNMIARGEQLPAFDQHVPIMSFPFAFGTTLDSIPADVPYLNPSGRLSELLQTKLDAARPSFRVGLVWAGNPGHYNDRNRSIRLAQLYDSLKSISDLSFFSLQKGEGAAQLADGPLRSAIVDLAPELKDLADTAAAMRDLDLVICVDTSIAHLAGAMGTMVFTLVPEPADFRWLIDRADSPWYPTMTLFRQAQAGRWDHVLERVADELKRGRS